MRKIYKTYVTFGQDHIHDIDGILFDKDCVAAITCENRKEGRDKAFEFFGQEFCMEYFDKEFNHDSLKWFPRGIINVPA